MAGFTDGNKGFFNSIIDNVKKIGSFGMAYGYGLCVIIRGQCGVSISQVK